MIVVAPTVIGIEACGAAHYLARLLGSFGHEVKLIPTAREPDSLGIPNQPQM
jgi:transposase